MVMSIKDSGLGTSIMGKEFIHMPMEQFMMEVGAITKLMVQEC
jgi:hypothetical protein